MPELFKDIEIAIRPGINELPGRVLGHDLFGGDSPQDAAGEAAQAFADLWFIGPAAVVDDLGLGALLFGVPDTFGQLQVGNDLAVDAFLFCFAQVHVCIM